jgi:hypothetical protein
VIVYEKYKKTFMPVFYRAGDSRGRLQFKPLVDDIEDRTAVRG